MKVFNEHKLLNVRVSKPTFEYLKNNAPYVEDKIPSAYGKIESPLKDHAVICMNYHIERMITHVTEKSLKVVNTKEKELLDIRCELSELFSELKKQNAVFTYIMAE